MAGMIRKIKYYLLPLFFFSILITACNEGNEIVVPTGKMFTLHPSQSARIEGENISMKFIKVSGDSRCPRDVNCIRAGEVTAEILISSGTGKETITITQPGLTDEDTSMEYKNYLLLFNIQPYPEAGEKITGDSYRLYMTVQMK